MVFDITHLKKIRKQLGLTQYKFAVESGISQSMVAKIESGKLDPTYSKVKEIEKALDRLSNVHKIKVKDIMIKKIIYVKPLDKVSKVIELMNKHSISQVPIIDNDRIVGLISESSILKKESEINKNSTAKQIMDEAPPIVSQDTDIDVIKKLLSYYSIVMIKSQGNLVGLVTRTDLIRHLE